MSASSASDHELDSQFGRPMILIKIDIGSYLWSYGSYGDLNPSLLACHASQASRLPVPDASGLGLRA
jgi:hypothetical protein